MFSRRLAELPIDVVKERISIVVSTTVRENLFLLTLTFYKVLCAAAVIPFDLFG
jgi:hypothetical protein